MQIFSPTFGNFFAKVEESRKDKDRELWQSWKENGKKKQDLKPLLQNLRPFVNYYMNPYLKADIPVPKKAIEAWFETETIKAVRTYNPDRGAKLTTHVRNKIRTAEHKIKRYQNVGAIPDHRVNKIGKFEAAHNQLADHLGRPPDSREIADKLGWNEKEVTRMQSELRRDLTAYRGFEPSYTYVPPKDRETLRLLEYELSPEEKIVFQHSFGLGGKAQLRPGDIAKEYNWSPSKVSSLKKKISEKLREHQ